MSENDLLFVNDHGRPITFNTKGCVRQEKLNKVIKENGGCVTEDKSGPYTILLVVNNPREWSGRNSGRHNTFSQTYIMQCIRRGKLLPLQRYWVTKDSGFDDKFSPNDVMLRTVTWSMCRLPQRRTDTPPQSSPVSREKKQGEDDTETHTFNGQSTIQVQPCSVLLDKNNTPVSERIDSPVSERMDSPVLERIGSPVSERMDSPLSERMGSPVSERMDSPVSERMDSPLSERMDSPVSERMDSPVSERMKSADKINVRECSVDLKVLSADEIKKACTSTTTRAVSTHQDDTEGALATQDGDRSPVSPHNEEVDEEVSNTSTVLFDLSSSEDNPGDATDILSSDAQSPEELDNWSPYLGKKSKGPVSKWKGQQAKHHRKFATGETSSEVSSGRQISHSREVQPRPRRQKRKKREDYPQVEEEEEEEDEDVVITRNVLRKPLLRNKASPKEKQKGLTSPSSRRASAPLQSDDKKERVSTTRKVGTQREAPAPHHGSGWISRLKSRPIKRCTSPSDASTSHECPLFRSPRRNSAEGRGAYTIKEDMEILDYIVQREGYKHLKGRAFWVSMAEAFHCRRTWQGLKERFRMRIVTRLESYIPHGLDREVIKILNQEMPVEKTESRKKTRHEFLYDEDLVILRFIARHHYYRGVTGMLLWRKMAQKCPELGHHTWQSLRTRFLKKILPNIHTYGLTEEEVLQFQNRQRLKEHQRQWLEERQQLPGIAYKRRKIPSHKTPRLSPRKAAVAALASRPPSRGRKAKHQKSYQESDSEHSSGSLDDPSQPHTPAFPRNKVTSQHHKKKQNKDKVERQERLREESDEESSSGSLDDPSQPHTLAIPRNKVTSQHRKKQQNKDKVECQERLREESDEESSSGSLPDLSCSRTLSHLRKKFTYQRHKKQQDQDDTMEIFQQSKAKKQLTATKPTSANGDMSQPSALEEIPEAPPRPKSKRLLPTNFTEVFSPKTPFRKDSVKTTRKIKETSSIAMKEDSKHRREKSPQEIVITTAETSRQPTKEGVTDDISDLEDSTEELPDLNITETVDANSQEERVEDSQESEECQAVRSEKVDIQDSSAHVSNLSPTALLKFISSTLPPPSTILTTSLTDTPTSQATPPPHQNPPHPSNHLHTPPQNSHSTTTHTTKSVTHHSPSILPDTPPSPVIPLLCAPQLTHPTPPQSSHLSSSAQHSQTASTSHISHSEMDTTHTPPPASNHTHPSNSPPVQHNSPSTLQPTLPRRLSTLTDIVNEHSDSTESSTVDVVSDTPVKKDTSGSRVREGPPSKTTLNNMCRKIHIKRK